MFLYKIHLFYFFLHKGFHKYFHFILDVVPLRKQRSNQCFVYTSAVFILDWFAMERGKGGQKHCGIPSYLYAGNVYKVRKQRNKNFTKNIIVFLLNNFIWTNRNGETNLYFLPVDPNKIRKTKYSWGDSCFIVLLLFESVLWFVFWKVAKKKSLCHNCPLSRKITCKLDKIIQTGKKLQMRTMILIQISFWMIKTWRCQLKVLKWIC